MISWGFLLDFRMFIDWFIRSLMHSHLSSRIQKARKPKKSDKEYAHAGLGEFHVPSLRQTPVGP